MGNILGVYLMPHPPIILEEIGRGQEREAEATINSMDAVAKEIAEKGPDTIILISPHGPLFEDGVGISWDPILKGDFSQFGVPNLEMEFIWDRALARSITKKADKMGIDTLKVDRSLCKTFNIPRGLDWGVLVPLYYVQKEYRDFELVTMGISGLPLYQQYGFGIAMRRAIEMMDRGVVIIASGDLSHRLKDDGPYGYHPSGGELDRQIITSLDKGSVEDLFRIDTELIEEGGECGLRSIIMAMGTLDGQGFSPRVLSYEYPFGVGYCVASFEPGPRDHSRKLLDRLMTIETTDSLGAEGDKYIRLAREALEIYVLEGRVLSSEDRLAQGIDGERAGVFVTIKQGGRLRGCIGTIEPTCDTIAGEIIYNAISAGTRDPRFLPVGSEELDTLDYSVDVLSKPEPVDSLKDLDVKRYGVIVTSGRRRGLLLPNLEGIEDPLEQVKIALEKAGISENEPYRLERFEVIRHQ